MAEIGWFLHRLAGRVTPPSLGLVFLTGNMKGLAKRIGKNPSTCGKLWFLAVAAVTTVIHLVLVLGRLATC